MSELIPGKPPTPRKWAAISLWTEGMERAMVEWLKQFLVGEGNVIRERSYTNWNELDVASIVAEKKREINGEVGNGLITTRRGGDVSHEIGWQDGGMAEVYACNGSRGSFTLTAPGFTMRDDPTRRCPGCDKRVRLVWDVRVEVVDDGENAP